MRELKEWVNLNKKVPKFQRYGGEWGVGKGKERKGKFDMLKCEIGVLYFLVCFILSMLFEKI